MASTRNLFPLPLSSEMTANCSGGLPEDRLSDGIHTACEIKEPRMGFTSANRRHNLRACYLAGAAVIVGLAIVIAIALLP
jgi:hypothetical protein